MPVLDLEGQIEKYMDVYTILPEFQQWAIEALVERHDIEVSDRSTVQESHQKEALKTRTKLDSLMRSRYLGEMEDEDFFKREKAALQVKLKRLG